MLPAQTQEKRKSDSFVNSQEWTLSRAVPDLRLGIVGSLASGKSALVHRYLTGSYMQEESPEGGRFKKEILVDGQSYLLLIRDEGGPPELQFTAWVDAVIFVFSLENEASFNAIYNYYTKMSHFRSAADIPLILVGTQDAISENNPRVIDDARARKLATDLKRCSYYETCATYGLNVERVFQDACQKIVQQRLSSSATCLTPTNSRPSTPNSHFGGGGGAGAGAGTGAGGVPSGPRLLHASPTSNGFLVGGGGGTSSSGGSPGGGTGLGGASPSHAQILALTHKESSVVGRPSLALPSVPPPQSLMRVGDTPVPDNNNGPAARNQPPLPPFDNLPPPALPPPVAPITQPPASLQPPSSKDSKDLPTPSSTPTTSRKSRRRSNLFTPSKKGDDKLRNGGGCELGSGRAIPLKQGYLYKRSSKALNKEWKKKYVTLCDDGRLTYHPSLHDYMDDVHGKEIPLQYVTVKVPGQRPRGTKPTQLPAGNGLADGLGSLTISSFQNKEQRRAADKVLLTAFELLREPGGGAAAAEDAATLASTALAALNGCALDPAKAETPNVKKRHRRMKSSGLRGGTEGDDSDGYEFFIVSLDNKQWHFEAGNSEERDEWVAAIEQQILTSLQGNESGKAKSRLTGCVDAAAVQAVRSRVPGNTHCADCDSPNPDWASLNLGVVVCIECSGIHRNLGSHISRVRSLDLDEWPPGHLAVMLSLGNALANSVWEAHTRGRAKPTPNSSREEKERWVRSKYEAKEFLATAPAGAPLAQQLLDAVCRSDMKSLALLLAHTSPDQVNTTVSARDLRTPLHLACATGNLAAAQLLLWHNANAKAVDHEGRSCLTYARAAANVALSKTASGTGTTPAGGEALVAAAALAELLVAHGCPDPAVAAAGGTLPRRRGSVGRRGGSGNGDAPFDRLPANAI